MTWIKSPEGKKHSKVCFYTGDTKGVKVYKQLHKLEKKIKCESIDTIVKGSGKAPNEIWRKWTFNDWVEASGVLADQTRGVASVALGQTHSKSDVFTVEKPRLEKGIKEKRVAKIDKYTMNEKLEFDGPTKL
ncbi:hypothetical protein FA13DRAFT_1726856 [Coprinellus micaceus]|uniref:Uncharacterized protein n=1 Tax=Coprinellus micaceus TaxID=71717 RepID=A0A4Y7TRG9_COPMI|nr:hypothetical protein FA13DRAFT_1726856 [Coprinellus micaceus]